ncbi:NAD(P)-binding protein [Cylindrobasidium torrendii FP15055 ss-10]|uniref:NAD(P)-binding protein n=1 Tax=Cylindrobasidium torrendii FP15055 ss-10 TaxID=1314674 RepID=A0A0D7BCH3_9AGAR|nr:NAD(P)-binding protein [Cylindrobasidium torrendii FP15055 ss-10]
MSALEDFKLHVVQDETLYSNAARANGKTVLITGAASGIGREAALAFAKYGAKIVIGDLNRQGGQTTVDAIVKAGGQATFKACNVTVWDDLVDLFEHGMKEYGAIDVVVANAGVNEIGNFTPARVDKNGRPQRPNLTTIDVNLIGAVHTAHLAQHYLLKGTTASQLVDGGPLKSLVLMGSISSWQSIPGGPLYTVSKHGILGFAGSLAPVLSLMGIRVSSVYPFFVDTGIVPLRVRVYLAGLPFTPIERVVGAIVCSATDARVDTNGSAWLLLNDGPVVAVPKESFKAGIYQALDKRSNAIMR